MELIIRFIGFIDVSSKHGRSPVQCLREKPSMYRVENLTKVKTCSPVVSRLAHSRGHVCRDGLPGLTWCYCLQGWFTWSDMVLLSLKLVVPHLGHFILYIIAWDKSNDPDFHCAHFFDVKGVNLWKHAIGYYTILQ